MKKFLPALLLFFACNGKSKIPLALQPGANYDVHQLDTANYTTINWIESMVEFGNVPRGKKVHIKFRFQNTGDKPLYLSSVKPSCGCTVANYTKGAVAPGGQGEVLAEFDSNHGFPGHVRKSITVVSNTINEPTHTLIFSGQVTDTAHTK